MFVPRSAGGAGLGTVVPGGLIVGDMVGTEVATDGWVVCTLEVGPVAEECSNAGLTVVVCC